MPAQLPVDLVVAWVLFFLSGVGQFHHEQVIRQSGFVGTGLLRAVEISQLLWLVAGAAILIYYFVVARWYWPLALAVGGSMLGALFAGLLFGVVGERKISILGFIVWPLAAAYAIVTIHGLPA